MAHKFSKDEWMQCKIKGQIKPFIDENLQFQIPLPDNPTSTHTQYCALYSHYSPESSSTTFPSDTYEIEKAMSEARKSYKGWKTMQEKVQQAAIDHSDVSMIPH